MNTLKYRVWAIKEKVMFDVKKIHFDFENDEVMISHSDNNWDYSRFDFSDIVLMQNTNFFLNSIEIFDGDLITIAEDIGVEVVVSLGTIEFNKEYGHWEIKTKDNGKEFLYDIVNGYNSKCEIIGNIYQNKDIWDDWEVY